MKLQCCVIPVISGLALWVMPQCASAWGCQGHQVVAYIAESELNSQAISAVNDLLTANPITGVKRFCTKPAGLSPMSDAATWADDVRDQAGNGNWHFIDVPLANAGEDPSPWCNDDCVLFAIQKQLAILRDPTYPDASRADALRYVIHFVGDVHQPLHATDDADRGGNCVPVFFKSMGSRSRGGRKTELHHIWDTEMIVELMDQSDVEDPQGLAVLLDKEITPTERTTWSTSTDPADWAKESSLLAAQRGYQGLTTSDGQAVAIAQIAKSVDESNPKQCNADATTRITSLHILPSSDYRLQAETAIDQRLKQAGIRLARMLNDTWPEDTDNPHAAFHAKGN